MRHLGPVLFAVTLSATGAQSAQAAHDTGCRKDALQHLRAASDGLAVYMQISDKGFFQNWIDCDDAQFDLPTAVHESTHFIAAEADAFPLIGGGSVQRPHAVTSFFPPWRIAPSFKQGGLVATYLKPGTSSSATDFLYLLDELNAYAHGVAAAVDLKRLSRPDEAVDHRDGLAAMMAFVAAYAEMAQEREPVTWAGLRQPEVAKTVATLWRQGERVLASSCGIPNFGAMDKPYIRRFCTDRARSALEAILGRAPVCPTACLAPEPDAAADEVVAERQDEGDATGLIPAAAPPSAVSQAEPSSWLGSFFHGPSGPAATDATPLSTRRR